MKKLLHIGLLFCFAMTVAAQVRQPPKVLREFNWKNVLAKSTNCQLISMDGMSVLKIENTDNAPLEILLLTITNSSLIQRATTIGWEMKYDKVRSLQSLPKYIGQFPSRSSSTNYPGFYTIEKYPPQAVGGDYLTIYQGGYFAGTKNWDKQDFAIGRAPYDNQTRPNELMVKLFLPSSGTVYLRPIKLMKWVSPNSGNWWTPQQSGLIGGIGGSLIGCLGGLIGLLVSKGKARNFVLAAVKCFIAVGIFLTIAGLVAALLKQPYDVWYALLLPGVILVLVFSLNLHSIQRRYDELEIRRMTSMDATGS